MGSLHVARMIHTTIPCVNQYMRRGGVMARRKRRDWGRGWVEVRQRRDGPVYVARWLEDGRQKSKTFATEADAEDHLDDLAKQKRRLTPRRGEVPTVAMAA